MRYLVALFGAAPPGSFVELRCRYGTGMRQSFIHVADLEAVERATVAEAPTTDVFVGVLPRRRRGGRRADVVSSGNVLWIDCDATSSSSAVRRFRLAPSIIVESGSPGHVHAYWLLDEAIEVQVIETLNVRLATALGGDARSTDAARILRPPSLNHRERPPASVRLARCDAVCRYSVASIAAELPDENGLWGPHSRARSNRVLAVRADPLTDIEPEVYVEVLAGLRVPRSRKVLCPFHEDGHPSLHVYRGARRGWYCFGCGRGGSIYDFAAALWGIRPRGRGFIAIKRALLTALVAAPPT